jgi:hypothetical protein
MIGPGDVGSVDYVQYPSTCGWVGSESARLLPPKEHQRELVSLRHKIFDRTEPQTLIFVRKNEESGRLFRPGSSRLMSE